MGTGSHPHSTLLTESTQTHLHPALSLAALRMRLRCPSPSRNPVVAFEVPLLRAPPWTWQLWGQGQLLPLCPLAQDVGTWATCGSVEAAAPFHSSAALTDHRGWPGPSPIVAPECERDPDGRRGAAQGSVKCAFHLPRQPAWRLRPGARWDLQDCRENPRAPKGFACACWEEAGSACPPLH